MLISAAVSHKSRTSSTIRASGLRTVNDLDLEWWHAALPPSREPEIEGDLEIALEEAPDVEVEGGPIGIPLYSTIGGGACSLAKRFLCRAWTSKPSSTLTMWARCSASLSCASWTSASARCSCKQSSECLGNHQGVICRSHILQRTGIGDGLFRGSLVPVSASTLRCWANISAPTPRDSTSTSGRLMVTSRCTAGLIIHIVC